MGVPKFYRWLSERYPCLSQVIKEHQIPEFDNLYLDMNGIIHPCSHPNDDDPHFRITEAQIFKNIFNYIEVLFRIIKPKKHFFMAVDGCAPRAKMNQQRSRRFRTAKEAEDSIRKAIQKGQTLPKEDRFDSNCITPGTEFMARLQEQLKYFVNKKISSDPLWQECTVYLSGHDVPGEGEHKIMDFIRYCKAEPTYDPNTRHCLYGLDADLLMLGLTTHEPYFCLLREEVRFGKQAKRLIRPEEQTFHLLHLTLLREYIDLEFGALKDELHFNYDGERIIDDWVLLGFLVGNDFVPHLPNMHINHDALPYIYRIYKEFLVTTDGYLNDGGTINLPRLKKFLRALSVFDRERFEDVYSDLKWLESKGSGKLLSNSKPTQSKKKFSELMKELTLDELEEDLRDLQKQAFHEANPYLALDDENGSSKEEDVEVEDEETFELEFKQHKRQYYMEKFDMDIADDEHINTICREYVIALQWISHYYFNGLQSWSWYYPYHYSPYISDVANFDLKEITLDMGSPFHPFEQLLAVLPAASRKLLPQAFQSLMVVDNSAIIDYYPSDFRTDLNGKQQDWEAVVLIPFIDEKRLLAAMEQHYALLTDEEKIRNSFGTFFEYTHDRALNFNYPSPHTEFEDLVSCRAKVVSQHMDLHRIDPARISKGLLKGTRLDTYYHGFPTMKHLQHEAYLEKAAVKVFQHQSRTLNTIIRIAPPKISDIGEVAKQLVGEIVYVEWPYMVEAMVTSVSNDAQKYFLGKQNELTSKMVQNHDYSIFKRELKTVTTYHMERRGINLGDVKILVQAKLLLGQRYNCGEKNTVKVEKEWSQNTNFYPLQTVVKELPVHEQTKEVFDSVSSLFPPRTVCFMLADLHYGCSGEVIEFDKQTGRVRVALTTEDEPSFEDIMQKYDSLSVHYLSDKAVAQRLGITTHLLGRITGNVFIDMSNEEQRNNSNLINVGLKLKYSGQNKEVLGYARRSAQGWTYSPATVAVIGKYMQEFPDLFEALGWATGKDNYNINTLLPGKKRKYMDQVVGFLKKQSCYNSNLVRCGSTALDEPVVQALEQCIDQHKESLENKVIKVKVKPHLLFRPTQMFGKLSPDPGTEFLLLDRVVNVQKGITVPLGMRGTVIGLHEVLSDEQDKNSATESRYEILFDEPFLGALKRRSKENRGYFMSGNSLLNVSYGERKVKEKSSTQLTSAMMFQSKISHSPVSAKLAQIPNSPSTPGIIRTPKNYNTPNSPYSPKSGGDWRQNYNRGHSSHDNTPQYTPTSSRDNTPQYTPTSSNWRQNYNRGHSSHDNTPQYTPTSSRNNTPQYTPTSSKYTPKQHQQKYTPQSRYDQSNNRYDQSNNRYDQSNSRYGSGGGGGSGGYQNKRAPQLTPKNLAQTNNDFMSMWQKAEQNQKEKSEKVDENATAIVKELIHMPNKSPKDSQQPPQQQSAATNLHQWCVAFNLPVPQYMYSESSQGVSAAVLIGQMLRIDGDISPNKNVAAESAATAALNHLLPMNPFSAMPAPPLSPFQPGPIMMFMPPPHQFQRGGPRPHQRYNNSPQHQQNRDYTPRKNKPASNMDSESQNRNMFVPHQVLVKNKSPAQPQDDSTAAELKSMLGIVSSEQPTASSTSSASSQHLKHLLGINQTNTEDVNSSVTKKANSEDEEALKKPFRIGLKPEIQEKSESTSTVEAGEIEISSATTAASVVTPSTTPLPPSSPIPSQTPSDNSTTSTTTDSNQKPKKKIQLATSFLGPKKK